MKFLKQVVRVVALTLIIIIASTGMITIFPNYRDRYMNREIRTEQREKQEDENSEQRN